MMVAILIAFFCDVRGQECTKSGTDTKEAMPVFNKSLSFSPENEKAETIVFPNPCRNELKVSCPRYASNARLEIYNCAGQLVLQEEMHSPDFFMDVQHVARGMYHVRIATDTETLAQGKFVKE